MVAEALLVYFVDVVVDLRGAILAVLDHGGRTAVSVIVTVTIKCIAS